MRFISSSRTSNPSLRSSCGARSTRSGSRLPNKSQGGVFTASAGNWAQGVAWVARERNIPCTIIVPDHAPKTKLAAIERLGARHIDVPYDAWWQCMTERRFDGVEGFFLHPVEDEPVMAGNGTIALELLEDLPDPDVVLVPWGGGGLSSGIASGLAELRPETRVYGVEVETAAPLSAFFLCRENDGGRAEAFVRGWDWKRRPAPEDVATRAGALERSLHGECRGSGKSPSAPRRAQSRRGRRRGRCARSCGPRRQSRRREDSSASFRGAISTRKFC